MAAVRTVALITDSLAQLVLIGVDGIWIVTEARQGARHADAGVTRVRPVLHDRVQASRTRSRLGSASLSPRDAQNVIRRRLRLANEGEASHLRGRCLLISRR